jgi:LacI family transcriptional regulator
VIIPTFTNPFYAEVLAGIEGTLSRASFGSEIATTDYDPGREHSLLQKIAREGRTKGVVIIPWHGDTSRLHEFAGELPMVLVDSCPPAMAGRCQLVRGDNFRGAFQGTQHLVSLGHRRIGLVHWKHSDPERREGFCAAMRENGLGDDPPTLLIHADQVRAAELLAFVEARQLTGLFVVHDMLAIQALHVLRTRGRRVPQDISVVGYDDIKAAEYLDVPLTTVSQHDHDIGRRAGQAMLELLAGEDAASTRSREILFTPNLIIRSSTAPPPGHAAP